MISNFNNFKIGFVGCSDNHLSGLSRRSKLWDFSEDFLFLFIKCELILNQAHWLNHFRM